MLAQFTTEVVISPCEIAVANVASERWARDQ